VDLLERHARALPIGEDHTIALTLRTRDIKTLRIANV
jgi:hypothetical protein